MSKLPPLCVSHKINSYGPFKLDCYFAFSNFENWGGAHNGGFVECIESARDKMCVIDIGAHIGLVSLPFSSVVNEKATVYSFEPASHNFKYLKRHTKYNSINNIKLENLLVGDVSKENVDFFEANEVSGMHSLVMLKDKGISGKTKRNQVSLDDYCKNNQLKPDLIKIDVEGAEVGVLKGAKETLKTCKPKVFLSVHPSHIESLGYSLNDMLKTIEECDYKITNIDGSKVTKFSLDEYILTPN